MRRAQFQKRKNVTRKIMSTSAPAVQSDSRVAAASPKKTFQSLVESDQFKAQLAAALPKHLTPDRFIRVLLTATMKTPLLLQCTQESMFKGILDAAAAGVELDGRRAHLIPFKNTRANCYEAQLIIDFKGIAELIMRSGVVSSIHADIVCENDVFEVDRGEVTKHVIDFKKDRGAMYAAYARIVMKDGGSKCEVMSKRDIDRIRQMSKASGNGPWVQHYDEMAKKTVFRRASKWVPLSPEIRNVVEDDDVIDIDAAPIKSSSLGEAIGSLTEAPTENQDGVNPTTTVVDEVHGDAPEPEKKVAPAPIYTAEQRAAVLKEVEGALLDRGITEAKAMIYVHQNKLAKRGQDEISALDTAALFQLRDAIPSLK